MMHTSDANLNSIRNAFLDAGVQLSVPTVTSTGLATEKLRAYSNLEETSRTFQSPTKKIRHTLSSLSFSFPKRFDLNKTKTVRAVPTQSSPTRLTILEKQNHSDLVLDNNNNPAMTAAVSSISKDYLSVPRCHQHRRTSSCSPTKHNKSMKNALLGIWQGLNHDESRSSLSSPIDPKYVEERVKKSTPSWKAVSKVVTSLLTFTRSKKGRYEWIQLVGHPGTFKEGIHDGYVLKELCNGERRCCELLQNDILKDFVPRYNGTVKDDEGKFFIEMEDLLSSFHEPCIMDCKIGVRTYLEDDLDKSERDPQPRADLYDKMIAIDPTAPTEKENEEKSILKPRYMMWRESLSSSENLGFRIEAIKKTRGLMSKEFQRIKERSDVKKQLNEFIANSLPRAIQYLDRLIELRAVCVRSNFFQTHELIGSSILFVHDGNKASLWMIDFGKTTLLPDDICTTHSQSWTRGSHEDGYLLGLDNLISLFREIIDELKLTLLSN